MRNQGSGLKRQRLRLGVYDTWRMSATFQFLYLFLFAVVKGTRAPRGSLSDCQNLQTIAMGLVQRVPADPHRRLCPCGSSCPRCWGKARSITVIPKHVSAAAMPSQRPGPPAPCGWQPWGPPAPWGEPWTHSVRSRQSAHDVVEIWCSIPQAGTSIWRPPQQKWRTNSTEDKQTS